MDQPDQRRVPQPPSLAAPGRRQFLRGVAGAGAVAGAGGLLAACSSPGPATTTSTTPAATMKSGGNLSCGLTGGSSADTIDPNQGLTYLDSSRALCLYSPLVRLNAKSQVEYVLAEGIEPKDDNPSEWIIRLRPGVTFHDGKDLTADDVIYTFRRVITNGYSGTNGLGPVSLKGLAALDKLTVRVPMTQPQAAFVDRVASYYPDATSLQDALITGVVQAAGTLDGPSMAALSSVSGVHPLPSRTGGFEPFTMRVDQAPFSDVRVRQALRLLVDRPQLIKSALDGYGSPGNDVFSPYDPDFDQGLPQREQDIPQAKFLLRQAGQEHLTVTLTTSPIATATVAMATVLAGQAKAAGVTIKLSQVPPGTFFGKQYLSWTFSQDYYGYSPYLAQVAQCMLPTSPFNETREADSHYINLYNAANATLDPVKRRQIEYEMQAFDYNNGGYIIPAFIDSLDAYSTKIAGYTTATAGQPLSNFGYENFGFVA